MIKRIEAGARYSSAVIHGGKVYLSGYVPETSAGQSIAAQTLDVLTQIEETLKEAGSDKSRILKANIYLADIATVGEMNKVWDKWVVPNETPARATVEAKLADPAWGVEIMIEAAI